MSPDVRGAARILASIVCIAAMMTGVARAQRHAAPRHPQHPARAVAVRGHVFVGGYYYDPYFGPYPWWHRYAYPYWYFPVYDNRADLHVRVDPDTAHRAAVYVDGFYAGIVNEFDGVFQSLPLPPGGHTIVLYLPGHRTVRQNIYLSPGGTFRLRAAMEPLAAGETSEFPDMAPPVPAPPSGSYRLPLTPPASLTRPAPDPGQRRAAGTLDLWVQPSDADVLIDGAPWVSSEQGHLVLQMAAGTHRLEIRRTGYRGFTREVDVREGETLSLNVTLTLITW